MERSEQPSFEWTWKIILLGDAGVGKTGISRAYAGKAFNDNVPPTVSLLYEQKTMTSNGETFSVQLWDTAGQERFRSVVRSYYRGAHGIVLVYDVTNRASFENCVSWLDDLARYSVNVAEVAVMLVGNKKDLVAREGEESLRKVSTSEAYLFAIQNRLFFMETSAKNGYNIDDAFKRIVDSIVRSNVTRANSMIPKNSSLLSSTAIKAPLTVRTAKSDASSERVTLLHEFEHEEREQKKEEEACWC
jgi:Ras-related protein Rab-1A